MSSISISTVVALGAMVANFQGHTTTVATVAFQFHIHKKTSRTKTKPFVRFGPAHSQDRHHARRFASLLPTSTLGHKEEEGGTARRRLLNFFCLRKDIGIETQGEASVDAGPFRVNTIEELNHYYNDERGRFRKPNGDIDYATLQASLCVEGDTQTVGSVDRRDVVHPVVQLLHKRKRAQSAQNGGEMNKTNDGVVWSAGTTSSKRNIHRIKPPDDGFRVALVVEGGGMRGCLTAGMVTAIHHLGLADTVDVVYGSSAGTVIGAYFITRQLPWFGPEVYYDALTTAGDRFINTKRFLRALGLGLMDPRLIKDVIFRRNHGRPVLDLSYLLNTTMQGNKPLDWDTFEEMQKSQPLKVVASGLKSERAFIMDMEKGSFSNMKELACCMQASCLLPGVAGPLMNMKLPQDDGTHLQFDMTPMNNYDEEGYEPLADALLYEPLPYRAATAEGATHVVCLRSRADGVDVTGKSSIVERLILWRFFLRKNPSLRKVYQYMKNGFHKRRYGEQVLELNKGANDIGRSYTDTTEPHLLPIAVPPGSVEVGKLETGRETIFEGVRLGFARCYDALVEDPDQRGKGTEVAKQVFPDDILKYDPLVYTSTNEPAYTAYLKELKHRDSPEH